MSDYLYGAASGLSQTIVGYPLDTCKVMMQNNKSFKDFNIKNVFNGMKYPLCSSMIVCSINFGSYSYMSEILNYNIIVSGAISGFIVSPIVFISDYGKISYQMNRKPIWGNLFRHNGFFCCSMRETLAYSVYFKTFYDMKERKITPFISGGIAGLANWTLTYPIDVIRTRQIANNCSIIDAIRIGSLWKGYLPCASRAIIVNAVGFYVYDTLKNNL